MKYLFCIDNCGRCKKAEMLIEKYELPVEVKNLSDPADVDALALGAMFEVLENPMPVLITTDADEFYLVMKDTGVNAVAGIESMVANKINNT